MSSGPFGAGNRLVFVVLLCLVLLAVYGLLVAVMRDPVALAAAPGLFLDEQ